MHKYIIYKVQDFNRQLCILLELQHRREITDKLRMDEQASGSRVSSSPVLKCDQTLLWRKVPCSSPDYYAERGSASFPMFPFGKRKNISRWKLGALFDRPVFSLLQPTEINCFLWNVLYLFGIDMQLRVCALNAHFYIQTDTVPTSVPEEGLGRDGVDEPLEQLARSLPAVVDFCQVC